MRDRWAAWCERIDCPGLAPRFEILDVGYSEPHRAYHTWRHIAECLDVWARAEEDAEDAEALELAIWAHDAVYRPLRSDNEERSAELGAALAAECMPSRLDPDRVRTLVLATRHPTPAASWDEELIQDVDLHVLGAPRDRYDEYEAQVRREYRWVPRPVYRKRRAQLLRSFLDAEHLFHTPWFRRNFEAEARENLERAIESLTRR